MRLAVLIVRVGPMFLLGCSGTGAATDTGLDPHTDPVDTAVDTEPPTESLPTTRVPYGPDNAWFHATIEDVPDDLASTGRARGDTPPNFTFVDQNGDQVELYQFYGRYIVLDIFTQWCPPCREAAPEHQAYWEELEDDGLVLLSIMEESNTGAPEVADLVDWEDEFGITHPVLADPAYEMHPYVVIGYPTLVVIDREMRIVEPDWWPADFEWLATQL